MANVLRAGNPAIARTAEDGCFCSEGDMYPNLKLQIFKRGLRQNHLAKQIGISDPILSKIIHGYREPTESERKLLASCLNADESWLFEKFEATTTSPPLRLPSLLDGD